MKTVLITGISGFIGSNLVRHFKDQPDIRLMGYSRKPEATADIKLVSGYSAALLDELSVDCVIHLAGIAHDLSGKYQDEDYDSVNFGMTASLYEEFLKSRATAFIFMSSIKAAADHASLPVDESVNPSPLTSYGRSKLKAEQFIIQNGSKDGKHFYIFRPSVIYGRGNKGNMHLLAKLIQSGMPYPLGKYDNQRSFLFIENLNFIVEQFIRNQFDSGVYHLSDGSTHSTSELIHIMAAAMQKRIPVWNLPKGIVDLLANVGSVVHLPFNRNTLSKLTESLVVSNGKVIGEMGSPLPFTTPEGLSKTYAES
ncbi:MAG TPA: NAD-dependent epimerase/dehydratase family protein [Cyclobacteriaceae bacterium]|nr:NAD-dependent epimerase/dehydratase family protein [Cyclobacteriaceae bacterium]